MVVSKIYSVTATTSNVSFASDLCGFADTLLGGKLTVTNPTCHYLLFPDCFSASGLKILDTTCLVIQSLNISSSISSLTLTSCLFSPVSPSASSSSGNRTTSTPTDHTDSSSLDGFDDEGMLDWEELEFLLPKLATLTVFAGNLQGSLPSTIPSSLSSLTIQSTPISGTIPSTLFTSLATSTANTISVVLDGTQIRGTLPASLFTPFASSKLTQIWFSAAKTLLAGSIPSGWCQSLPPLSSFTLNLANNNLYGSIPANLFATTGLLNSSLQNSFTLSLASNGLSGTIPQELFSNIGMPYKMLSVSLMNNMLTGTLPAEILPLGWNPAAYTTTTPQIIFIVSNNSLSGTIPSTLLCGSLTANTTLGVINMVLDSNRFEGPLPEHPFYCVNTNKRGGDSEALGQTSDKLGARSSRSSTSTSGYTLHVQTLSLSLDLNQVTGSIPTSFLAGAFDTITNPTPVLSLGNNQLTGPVEDFFQTLPTTSNSRQVFLANNKLSGSLPSACAKSNIDFFEFAENQFSGSIPDTWKDCDLYYVSIGGNIGINGSLPAALLNNSRVYSLNVSHTSLSGELTSSVTGGTFYIDMSHTNIDFCTSNSISSLSSYISNACSLDYSSACDCSSSYPKCSASCIGAPTAPVPTVPVPTAAPLGCPGSSPGPSFICVGNTWTAENVNATTLVLPSGVGTVVITGNLSSSSVVISGIGSSVAVSGCASNLSLVHIDLDKEQVDKIGTKLYTLISSSGNCSTNLDSVMLTASIKNGGCRKVSVKKVTLDGGSTLGGLFTIDKSSCNTWWIILVSVVCGVILLAVIVVVLLAAFVPAFREKIRPFSKRSRMTRQATV